MPRGGDGQVRQRVYIYTYIRFRKFTTHLINHFKNNNNNNNNMVSFVLKNCQKVLHVRHAN
jgi:hypothetical protein